MVVALARLEGRVVRVEGRLEGRVEGRLVAPAVAAAVGNAGHPPVPSRDAAMLLAESNLAGPCDNAKHAFCVSRSLDDSNCCFAHKSCRIRHCYNPDVSQSMAHEKLPDRDNANCKLRRERCLSHLEPRSMFGLVVQG